MKKEFKPTKNGTDLNHFELLMIHRFLQKNEVKHKFSDEIVLSHVAQTRRSIS